jgi:hypothetical protein
VTLDNIKVSCIIAYVDREIGRCSLKIRFCFIQNSLSL